MPTEKLTYSSLPMTTATANTTYVLDMRESRTTAGTMIDLDGVQGVKFVLNGALYAGNVVLNYGAMGQDSPAIDLVVGKTGFIESKYEGFLVYADESTVDNRGVMSSSSGKVVEMHGDGLRLVNSGTMVSHANDAVSLYGAGLTFENTGTISGGVRLISELGSKATIVNSGRIYNESTAIGGGAGDDTVINSGLVRSEIRLFGGDDVFIDKGGHVSSAILGGAGDDVFVIRTKGMDIRENDGEGIDTIRSSVSWELDQEFEIGRLTGGKNINLTANLEGAELYGNSGSNKLFGQNGIDKLDGGRGNDSLTGGGNGDTFMFKVRAGDDIVTDFTDGADRIDLQNYKGIDDFGDLGVKQDGKDVVISLLGGDTITLRGFDKDDLSDADFMF